MPFIFDTNSLRVLGNYYPEQFPSFWERFEALVEKKDVLSVREVYNEIVNQIKDEWYLEWLKTRKEMFLTPGSEEGQFVAEIFKVPHFQQLVGEEQRLKGQYVADPWVVACAKVCNGIVVTEEAVKEHAAKIPNDRAVTQSASQGNFTYSYILAAISMSATWRHVGMLGGSTP